MKHCIIKTALNSSLFCVPLTRILNELNDLFAFFFFLNGQEGKEDTELLKIIERAWQSMHKKTLSNTLFFFSVFRKFYTEYVSTILCGFESMGVFCVICDPQFH